MDPKAVADFRAFHRRDRMLVLANAWDAASTAIVRSLGAEAIATTSAGVAWACGYPDGDALPHAERIFAVRCILRAAKGLPLSVDFEGGYSDDPQAVASLVCELRSLGVAGINLEDGGADASILERKIASIKKALHASGDDIFVNARTDIYLSGATGPAAVRESSERARRYEAAGADGIFVPAIREPEEIEAVAAATSLPLNVMLIPGLPALLRLYELGARRLSAGSAIAELGFGVARDAARALLERGDMSAAFSEKSVSYGEMNDLFPVSRR